MGIFDKLFSRKETSDTGAVHVFVRKDVSDPEGQMPVGLAFFTGHKVPQNYSEAAKWYRKAAEQGHREAQFCLATCYHRGTGVRQADGAPRHR